MDQREIGKEIKMDSPNPGYNATADALTERILSFIPDNPQILTMKSAWDLFDVPNFQCNDIAPSLAQAMCALGNAQHIYRKNNGT